MTDLDLFLDQYKDDILKQVKYLNTRSWVTTESDVIQKEHDMQFIILKSLINRIVFFLENGGRARIEEDTNVKVFIVKVEEIIQSYPYLVSEYLRLNDWTLLENVNDAQTNEITFQSKLMDNSMYIKKTLKEMNIHSEMDGLAIEIQGDDKIPFIMRHKAMEMYQSIPKFLEQRKIKLD
jgi:hypothetical protein|tara:strand:- start:2091 stop:2627 length:537 start_codon:yes stop_codon:yes gene_type:complete